MTKMYAIRPHLYYSPNADNGVTPEKAVALMKMNIRAVVSSRGDAIKTLLLYGWSPEDIAFTMSYALNGSPIGAGIPVHSH